jgi:hypothetical protein
MGSTVELWLCAAGMLGLSLPTNPADSHDISALFLLHDSSLMTKTCSIADEITLRQSIGIIAAQVDGFIQQLVDPNASGTDLGFFSPFTPYCLYQAAVVQRQLWQDRELTECRNSFHTIISVLQLFSKRWRVADFYLHELEVDDNSRPIHIHSQRRATSLAGSV